jgi:glucosamine-6-phosphate isomerase
MKIEIEIAANYEELSVKSAKIAADYINANPDKLICFAAGHTQLGTYRELAAMQKRGETDLSSVFYAQLDEWAGLGLDDAGSCIQLLTEEFFKPANIKPERILAFDGLAEDLEAQCRKMEDWINKHGGIGFSLLGIGLNGHIGFNEPDAPDSEGCFVISLDDTTKTVSSKYFGKSLPVQSGVTIGWKTLLKSGAVLLQANGENKAAIIKEAVKGKVTVNLPASLLQNHENSICILDNAAASMLNS